MLRFYHILEKPDFSPDNILIDKCFETVNTFFPKIALYVFFLKNTFLVIKKYFDFLRNTLKYANIFFQDELYLNKISIYPTVFKIN